MKTELSLMIERRSKFDSNSFLGRLMMKSEEETRNILLSTHRGAITWYLRKKLSKTSEMQRDQQEVRLMREVEKSKRCKVK